MQILNAFKHSWNNVSEFHFKYQINSHNNIDNILTQNKAFPGEHTGI